MSHEEISDRCLNIIRQSWHHRTISLRIFWDTIRRWSPRSYPEATNFLYSQRKRTAATLGLLHFPPLLHPHTHRYSGGGLVTGISYAEKERLKLYIDQSLKSLKCETDKILNQILKKLDIDSDLECCCLINSMPSSSSFCPLHNSVALNSKYPLSFDQLVEQAQKNLEEFLDVIMSKCRPMTCGEKQQLGQRIRSLPKKALERVVEIIQYRHHSLKPMDEIDVNLDEEEDVTLWRLYTYVEIVRNANKS